MRIFLWTLVMTVSAPTIAAALDLEQLRELRTAVIEMCRGGTTQGSSAKINVEASATGKLVIVRKLLEGGADAKVELTREEWAGIQALINPDEYSACVTRTLDILVPALDKNSQ